MKATVNRPKGGGRSRATRLTLALLSGVLVADDEPLKLWGMALPPGQRGLEPSVAR